MEKRGVIQTPDAYKMENVPIRTRLDKIFGTMSIEKQIEE